MLPEGPLGIFLQTTVYYYIIPSYTSWEEVVTSVKKIMNYWADFCDRIYMVFIYYVFFNTGVVKVKWKQNVPETS